MSAAIAQILIGVLTLIWILSKEPNLRGGRPVSRKLKGPIILLGLFLLGLGIWECFHRLR
jgi:hypothetical protein